MSSTLVRQGASRIGPPVRVALRPQVENRRYEGRRRGHRDTVFVCEDNVKSRFPLRAANLAEGLLLARDCPKRPRNTSARRGWSASTSHDFILARWTRPREPPGDLLSQGPNRVS
jgi:hypothetical protein